MTVKADFSSAEPRLSIRVACIVRSDRTAPHYRIRAIGGTGRDGRSWRLSEEAAIAAIENERASFYIEGAGGQRVGLTVGIGVGKLYLKTKIDMDSPEGLLGLPECEER
ncbi:MAG: DUF3892 domain-containing protein [Chloroflexi bacterium]|nr:DUF3892 domain-containing protein [Chloroflexota bacterium]